MISSLKRELLAAVFRVSLEAVSLEDLGSQVLPLLERFFDTSASILYHCPQESPMPVAGNLIEVCEEYARRGNAADPLYPEESQSNLPVAVLSRLEAWKDYLKSEAFHEFMHPRDADHLVHIRLTDSEYHSPGMVGLVLARSFRQPDFSREEEKALHRILDPLRAVAKRNRRLEEKIGVAHAILEERRRDEIALGLDGRFLWSSRGAHGRLALRRGGKDHLPPVLVSAARKLGELARGKSAPGRCLSEIDIPRDGGLPIRARLKLVRAVSGETFVLAELDAHEIPPEARERLKPFQLTPAEIKVLGFVAQGLSDGEISRRLFVSHATIRTHVGRILEKLGVDSRVQAALLTHGFHPSKES